MDQFELLEILNDYVWICARLQLHSTLRTLPAILRDCYWR